MKILFIGDVVGRSGRHAVKQLVPIIKETHKVDIVIANGENSAGGAGLNVSTAQELFSAGADVLTLGDHAWDQKDLASYIEKEPRIIRPANYPPGAPGKGSVIINPRPDLPPIAVLNLQGRTFMRPMDNPFLVASEIVAELAKTTPVIFVDFHAEATSEKIALGHYLDGKVSAVIGTHTHVQTADEHILPGGTAFLCDAGFTGAHYSVIGREIEPVLKSFLTGLPQRFEVAGKNTQLDGAVVEIDETSGKALSIIRIAMPVPIEG